MATYGLYLLEAAGVVQSGDDFRPGWVKEYDPDAFDGRGKVITTQFPAEALTFTDVYAAALCWRRESRVRPLRADGKPNRPLTAFTVEVRPLG